MSSWRHGFVEFGEKMFMFGGENRKLSKRTELHPIYSFNTSTGGSWQLLPTKLDFTDIFGTVHWPGTCKALILFGRYAIVYRVFQDPCNFLKARLKLLFNYT